jgi:hypothetical protein
MQIKDQYVIMLRKLIGKKIFGFSSNYIRSVEHANRPVFIFRPELSKFEYCNPGALLIYYFTQEEICTCLEFNCQNYLDKGEGQYPELVLSEYEENNNYFNSFILNRDVSYIEIYSTIYEDFTNDQLLLFVFKDSLKMLIEFSASLNGAIILHLNELQIEQALVNKNHIQLYNKNYIKRLTLS